MLIRREVRICFILSGRMDVDLIIERSGYQFRHSESGWIPKILQQTFQCYQVCDAQIGRIIRAGGLSRGFYPSYFLLTF